MIPSPPPYPLLHALESLRTPVLDTFILAVSEIGHGYWLLAAGALLLWFGSPRIAHRVFFAVLSADILCDALKHVCRTPRPWLLDPALLPQPDAASSAGLWSFPSGHAADFAAFALTLAACAPPGHRRGALAGAVLLSLLMAFSRLYLGVHTLADVLAGLAIAVLVAVAAARFAPAIESSPRARHAATAFALIACAALWIAFHAIPPPPDIPPFRFANSLYRAIYALLALIPSVAIERSFIRHVPADLPPGCRIPLLLLGLWGLSFTVFRLPILLSPGLGHALAANISAAANPVYIALLFPLLLLPVRIP